jgi:hypothetical protein
MQVDTQSFPINTIDVACEKVLVRPEMADKSKNKDIIIDDPRTSNISQKEDARQALDNKTNKSESARGQTQLRSRARQPDLSIADGPAPTCGQSGAHKGGPVGSARQSAHGQRRQRPHKARKETQGQSQHDVHGWLAKASPTFDQLLAENASKNTVPYDRSTKKPRSPAKTKRPNKTAQKATTQAPHVHPMRPGYFSPVYSSSVYYPVQIWNGMTMNPWHMYSPFVYLD